MQRELNFQQQLSLIILTSENFRGQMFNFLLCAAVVKGPCGSEILPLMVCGIHKNRALVCFVSSCSFPSSSLHNWNSWIQAAVTPFEQKYPEESKRLSGIKYQLFCGAAGWEQGALVNDTNNTSSCTRNL